MVMGVEISGTGEEEREAPSATVQCTAEEVGEELNQVGEQIRGDSGVSRPRGALYGTVQSSPV